MAGPSATLETRFTANITQMEAELKRLTRLNNQAASNAAAAHARAAKASNNAWANSNIGKALESQLRGIGPMLKQYGALFASMFAGHEALNAVDTYTRFTNSLKVAGLEGTALNQVQDQLYASAVKNGVALEPLGKLYGRAQASAKELGASQKDLLQFTNGVSSALRVAGTSTEEASGALLQLSQLLGGAVVHAEEFNSVNEGARPILEAVARGNEKYGGSVAKLRAEVLKQKVTSREFFNDFLAGSASLESQAAKAPLTVGASFQNLQTAFTRYIGETNEAWAISEKLTAALASMADNFDILVESVAVLGGIYAATFVPALGRAAAALALGTVATARSTAASIADTVALITRTSAIYGVSTASATATVAARGLGAALSFFGGPIGIAVMAIAASIAYLGVTSAKAGLETSALTSRIDANAAALESANAAATKKRVETGNLTTAEHQAAIATANMTGEAHKLKDAYYLAAAAAKALALQQARLDMISANKDQRKAREGYESRVNVERGREIRRNTSSSGPGSPSITTPLTAAQERAAKARAYESEEGQLWARSVRVNQARVGDVARIGSLKLDEYRAAPASAPENKSGGKPKGGGGSKPSDNTDASNQAIEQAEKAYRAALTASAQTFDERHKFALENLKAERDDQVEDLKRRAAKGEITKAAAESAAAIVETTYQQNITNAMLEHGNNVADQQNRITQQVTDLRAEELRLEADHLNGLADETKDLRKRAMYQREALEKRQQAEDEAFKVAQDILALDRLREGYTREEVDRLRLSAQKNRDTTKRNEMGNLERDQKNDTPKTVKGQLDDYAQSFGSMNEQLGNIAKNGIDTLTNGLTDAIMGAKSFEEAFGEMAKAVIAQLIQMAVRFAIFEAIGAAFGMKGLGKASLGIARNAKGTDFFGGGLSLIGENGPELVGMPRGAQVVPNNLLRNAFTAPSNGGPSNSVTNITTNVHANDAVLTSTVKGWIQEANVGAVTASNKVTQQNISKRNNNTLMRR